MQKLESWLQSEPVKQLKQSTLEGVLTKEFFRDPIRPIFTDPTVFYAPADGVVVYVHPKLSSDDKIIEVKGKLFNLSELLDEDLKPSLIIGIFMTSLDVHINRAPASSTFIYTKKRHPLESLNVPMLFFEAKLLDDFKISRNKMDYLFKNERVVNKFYINELHQDYYIVQIADKEINAISVWIDVGDQIMQGDRFGMVRWGSQVDLVIPIKGKRKYEILCQPKDHVEAGIDALVKIN